MGTGSKRYPKDMPIISPQVKAYKGRGGGISSGEGASENLLHCPRYFKVELEPVNTATESILRKLGNGTKLSIGETNGATVIRAGMTPIAKFPPAKGKQIAGCIRRGFRYAGVLREEEGKLYGAFRRTE